MEQTLGGGTNQDYKKEKNRIREQLTTTREHKFSL
jgi:hypothetical protein